MLFSDQDVKTTFIPASEAEEWIAEQEAKKEALMGKPTPDPEAGLSLYERSMRHANKEQKERLENIDHLGYTYVLPDEFTKQILIIMGELPEDTPHLTYEQAIEIVNKYKLEDDTYLDLRTMQIMNDFNEIAGAPDVEYGSGISHIIYFLDDEYSSWIDISMGFVYYQPSREAETIGPF